MALSGNRLKAALATDIGQQLIAMFQLNGDLLPAEKQGYLDSQQKIADAIANAAGPDVVSEITGNAVVPGITAGPGATVVT